jgi:(2Fe-2S) ferredoxin
MMSSSARPKYRVVLCMGEYCNLGRRADKLYKALQPMIAERNEGRETPLARLETARCLSMCGRGPNLVIYPDDSMYHNTQEADLKDILDRHLKDKDAS